MAGTGALVLAAACGRFGADSAPASTTDGGAQDGGATITTEEAAAPDAVAPIDASIPEACLTPIIDVARPCELPCAGGSFCQSCRDIKAAYPGAVTNLYRIAGKDNDVAANIPVYCDMVTEGGGWILVARSETQNADNAQDDFAWYHSTGDPVGDDAPFSLDLDSLDFAPTEILYGSRGDGRAWGANVYHVKLSAGFFAAHTATAVDIRGARRAVLGTCSGGSMQAYVGHTGLDDHFFFRDNGESDVYGLTPIGWQANHQADCAHGGLLSEKEGMIFVR